jgi:hypothetical protein
MVGAFDPDDELWGFIKAQNFLTSWKMIDCSRLSRTAQVVSCLPFYYGRSSSLLFEHILLILF